MQRADRALDAGIADQNVDPAAPALVVSGEASHRLMVAHVASDGAGVDAALAQDLRERDARRRHRGRPASRRPHARPRRWQSPTSGLGGARDECDLVVEPEQSVHQRSACAWTSAASYWPSTRTNSMRHGAPERLAPAWLVPRWTTTSPGLNLVSLSSNTSVSALSSTTS